MLSPPLPPPAHCRLDDVITNEMPSLYKIETIGDAYMVCGNLMAEDVQHAACCVRFALRAQQEAAKVPTPGVDDGSPLRLRIGEGRRVLCVLCYEGSGQGADAGCVRWVAAAPPHW